MGNSIKELMAIGQQGLVAQKSAMNVISRNIANANTPGYARQRLELVAIHQPGISIDTGALETVRSASIQRSILGAALSYGFHKGKHDILKLAAPALNDINGGGISAALDQFFASFSKLGNDPSGTAERLGVLHSADHLGNTLREASQEIIKAKLEAQFEAQALVDEVNTLSKKVALLNSRITDDKVGFPDPTPGLKNDRDLLLNRLSELVGINTVDKANGTVAVFLETGGTLADDTYSNTLKLTGGSLAALDVEIIKKDGSVMKPLTRPGGRLGGIMVARDTVLKKTSDELDQLAFGFVAAMNGAHSAGFGLDGSTGNNLFNPIVGVVGAASRVKLSDDVLGKPEKLAAALDPTMLPGDNANILIMMNLQNDATVVAGGKTVGEAYDDAMSTLAVAKWDARRQSDDQEARVIQFYEMREQLSGVALHEEMIALNQAERAFSASSQLIKTARDMYDVIMRMV
jgi:flagellar hook-associated protein 1 FlgK